MNDPVTLKSTRHRLANSGSNADGSAPASARQAARLRFLGIPFREPLTVAQAGVYIDRSNADPSHAARIEEWHLRKFELHPDLYPPTSAAAIVPDRPEAEFHLPPRGEDEPGATVFQKRRLELFGNCDLPVIDSLGRDQAAALIKYLEAQSVARSLERLGIRAEASQPEMAPVVAPAPAERPVLLAKPVEQARSGGAGTLTAIGGLLVVGAVAYFVFGPGIPGPGDTRVDQGKSTVPAKSAATVAPAIPAAAGASKGQADNAASLKQAVAVSQSRAVKKYPALGQNGSRFNAAFVARYQQLSQKHSPLLSAPDWPEKVADECAAQLPAAAYVK